MVHQKDSVIEVLNQLCRERYTVDELRARPLPEGLLSSVDKEIYEDNFIFFLFSGVDPSRIESYLSDDDFQVENKF